MSRLTAMGFPSYYKYHSHNYLIESLLESSKWLPYCVHYASFNEHNLVCPRIWTWYLWSDASNNCKQAAALFPWEISADFIVCWLKGQFIIGMVLYTTSGGTARIFVICRAEECIKSPWLGPSRQYTLCLCISYFYYSFAEMDLYMLLQYHHPGCFVCGNCIWSSRPSFSPLCRAGLCPNRSISSELALLCNLKMPSGPDDACVDGAGLHH